MSVFFVWEFVSILVDNEFGFLEFYTEILHTSGTDNDNHNKVGVIFLKPEEVGMKHGENSVEGEGIKETKNIKLFSFLFAPHFFATDFTWKGGQEFQEFG